MSMEESQQNVRACYVHLKRVEASARCAHENLSDWLRETTRQRAQEHETAFAELQPGPCALEHDMANDPTGEPRAAGQQTAVQRARGAAVYRWTTSGWNDPCWQNYRPPSSAAVPSCIRLGELELKDAPAWLSAPALAPLLGHRHIFIAADPAWAASARQLLQVLVLRLVLSCPPEMLRLSLLDPVGLGANFALFQHLPEAVRGGRVCTNKEEISSRLKELEAHIKDVLLGRLQNLYATIDEYNQEAGGLAVPYHVVVLVDFARNLDEAMWKQFSNIALLGPRVGVHILATVGDDGYWRQKKTDLQKLGTAVEFEQPAQQPVVTTSVRRVRWNDTQFGNYTLIPDIMPPADQVNQWLAVVRGVADEPPPGLPFDRFAIPEAERWTGNTSDGIDVPIGIAAGGEIQHFRLGQQSGTVHHALIGGTVRSGKTNLLHVITTQMALLYPPDEVELYLLDFKEAVEFQGYLTLPHARVVARESEREFGLSVLHRFRAQMEERGRLYKEHGLEIYEVPVYRARTGQVLSRVLLVIDEFQVLFASDDGLAQQAGGILEDLVRRGPSFGIHVVLCSQSPSAAGLYRDRIFNDMGLRIAFRCRAEESAKILGEGNDAADRLERIGQAIFNTGEGHRDKNVYVQVAHLPGFVREFYRTQFQSLAGSEVFPAPYTFDGRALARLENCSELQAVLEEARWLPIAEPAKAWLGEPLALKGTTSALVERMARSNVLIVGGNEAEAYPLLLSVVISLAAQRSPKESSFYVFDFARSDSPVVGCFQRLGGADGHPQLPHSVKLADRANAGDILAELSDALNLRMSETASPMTEIYVVIAGLQRWRQLRGSNPPIQSDAAMQVTRLAEEGPEVGIHVIAWADSFAIVERVLRRSGLDFFDLRVALRMKPEESTNLLGVSIAARLVDNRALFRHEDMCYQEVEKFKPFTTLEPEAMDSLVKQVRVKAAQEADE